MGRIPGTNQEGEWKAKYDYTQQFCKDFCGDHPPNVVNYDDKELICGCDYDSTIFQINWTEVMNKTE